METVIISGTISLCTGIFLIVFTRWWNKRSMQAQELNETLRDLVKKIDVHIAVQEKTNEFFEQRLKQLEGKAA